MYAWHNGMESDFCSLLPSPFLAAIINEYGGLASLVEKIGTPTHHMTMTSNTNIRIYVCTKTKYITAFLCHCSLKVNVTKHGRQEDILSSTSTC